jgi:hypothetical protein
MISFFKVHLICLQNISCLLGPGILKSRLASKHPGTAEHGGVDDTTRKSMKLVY